MGNLISELYFGRFMPEHKPHRMDAAYEKELEALIQCHNALRAKLADRTEETALLETLCDLQAQQG